MIVYYLVLPQQGWGWAPVFIYVACAVFRLARFNVTQAGASKTYFIGLPSPAAGGTLATFYWFTQTGLFQNTRIVDLPWQDIMPIMMLLLGAMMSSAVPYPAWPKVGLRTWRAFAGLVGVIAIVTCGILFTKYFFFLFGVAYVSYGLLRALLLSVVEVPNAGAPRRRATDYVDPMESYGMHTDEHPHLLADGDEDDELMAEHAGDGAADPRAGRRRKRRRRHRPGTTPPNDQSNA
jgi:CDP-diacylglycerol--serine O-phosphatidyltransferase